MIVDGEAEEGGDTSAPAAAGAAAFANVSPKLDTSALFGDLVPKLNTSDLLSTIAPTPKLDTSALFAVPKLDTSALFRDLVPKLNNSAIFADLAAKLSTDKSHGDTAGVLPVPSPETLTSSLTASKIQAGRTVAESIDSATVDHLLDELIEDHSVEFFGRLAAPDTVAPLAGAVRSQDPLQGKDYIGILDWLGMRYAEILSQASTRVRSAIDSITLRNSKRVVALFLLAELQLMIFISDRPLFEYIDSHFGFQANILAVWLFLRPRGR